VYYDDSNYDKVILIRHLIYQSERKTIKDIRYQYIANQYQLREKKEISLEIKASISRDTISCLFFSLSLSLSLSLSRSSIRVEKNVKLNSREVLKIVAERDRWNRDGLFRSLARTGKVSQP